MLHDARLETEENGTMSNWNQGPQSYAESAKMAQQSHQQYAPGCAPNTSNWNWMARENYYKNGGK